MNPPRLLLLSSLLLFSSHGVAQSNQPPQTAQQNISFSFRPIVAIVIGIFAIMFFFTFLLLMYAKFCHTAGAANLFGHAPDYHHHPNGPLQPQSARFSGIDKTVIESLPFFRFSLLKGSREGLECSVCLSRFEDTETLRLLPKCKHAFHVDCVDRWLESHSSCPLCRYKVEVEDMTLFKYSNSSRFLFPNPSVRRDDTGLELFVEREPGDHGSSRFTLGSSFRKIEKKKKKKESLLPGGGGGGGDDDGQFLHKFKHKIIVSDVVFKNRWSDVNSSDLMSLNSEMLDAISSKRFLENGSSTILKIKEEAEKKRLFESKITQINGSLSVATSSFPSRADTKTNLNSATSKSLIPSGNNRSMSEITNFSRFADLVGRSRGANDASNTVDSTKDEKMRRLWLPIARRTVQWLAGREKRSETQFLRPTSNV